MKHFLILLLLELCTVVCVFSQATLQEIVIENDDNPQIFYKGKGCTPDVGVIVFYTAIPDLKFSMPDTPSRLKNVAAFDKENYCYVLCVQPTDTKIGGIIQYSIDISGAGYKPIRAFMVKSITSGVAQYFKIKIEEDWKSAFENLKKEIDKLKDKNSDDAVKKTPKSPERVTVTVPSPNPVCNVEFDNGIYTGDLLVEKRHGFGIYKWNDGDKYEGYWENDKRHGKGVFEWKNGNKYEGNYENGKMNGYGVWHNQKMKFRYEENFANDKFNGYGEYYHDNGWCYKGNFKDGVPNGEGIRYDEKGKIVQQGIWENGEFKSKIK